MDGCCSLNLVFGLVWFGAMADRAVLLWGFWSRELGGCGMEGWDGE